MRRLLISELLAVALFANSSYSMEALPTKNHESQEGCNVTDLVENDKIYAIQSLQIEHSEENMKAFSEPVTLTSPLLDGSFSVRISTAESILKGLGAYINVINLEAYLTTPPANSYPLILQEYKHLVERSTFVNLDDSDGPYVYRRKQPTAADIAKFLTMVEASLVNSEVGRRSLILSLAANECMKTLAPKKAAMLESSEYMPDYIKKRIEALRQWSGGIFIESIEEPDATMEYPYLTIGSLNDVSFDFQGFAPTVTLAPGSIKLTTLRSLMHEFNHGTHTSLGLGNYSMPFLENYFANLFLKELMFNSLEHLEQILGGKIGAALSQLGSDEGLLKLFRKTMQDFLIDYAGSGVKVSPITADILQQKDEFVKELAHRLALRAVGEMWHGCSEETNNLIGVQLVGNTLFINTSSDMDCSLEKKEAIRWPYEARTEFASSPVSEADLGLPMDGLGNDAIEAWFKKVVGYCYDNGIGKPTERAWKTLLELHGVKN